MDQGHTFIKYNLHNITDAQGQTVLVPQWQSLTTHGQRPCAQSPRSGNLLLLLASSACWLLQCSHFDLSSQMLRTSKLPILLPVSSKTIGHSLGRVQVLYSFLLSHRGWLPVWTLHKPWLGIFLIVTLWAVPSYPQGLCQAGSGLTSWRVQSRLIISLCSTAHPRGEGFWWHPWGAQQWPLSAPIFITC